MDKLMKNIVTIVIIFFVISGILILSQESAPKPEDITLSSLVSQINDGQVKTIDVSGDDLSITYQNGDIKTAKKEAESTLSQSLLNYGVTAAALGKTDIQIKDQSGFLYWMENILPLVLLTELYFCGMHNPVH